MRCRLGRRDGRQRRGRCRRGSRATAASGSGLAGRGGAGSRIGGRSAGRQAAGHEQRGEAIPRGHSPVHRSSFTVTTQASQSVPCWLWSSRRTGSGAPSRTSIHRSQPAEGAARCGVLERHQRVPARGNLHREPPRASRCASPGSPGAAPPRSTAPRETGAPPPRGPRRPAPSRGTAFRRRPPSGRTPASGRAGRHACPGPRPDRAASGRRSPAGLAGPLATVLFNSWSARSFSARAALASRVARSRASAVRASAACAAWSRVATNSIIADSGTTWISTGGIVPLPLRGGSATRPRKPGTRGAASFGGEAGSPARLSACGAGPQVQARTPSASSKGSGTGSPLLHLHRHGGDVRRRTIVVLHLVGEGVASHGTCASACRSRYRWPSSPRSRSSGRS